MSGSAVCLVVFQQHFTNSFPIEIHMPHNPVKALNCCIFKFKQVVGIGGRAVPLPACPGSWNARSHAPK